MVTNPLLAEEVKVFKFTDEEFSTLEVRKVRGADAKTKYFLGSNENGNFLKAVANNAASGLGKKIEIDLNNTPFLNITWKVEKDLEASTRGLKKGMTTLQVFVVKKQGQHLYQIGYELCIFKR